MAAATGTPSGIKVLVVEDHADSARAMSRLLQSFGHQVDVAHSLHEGRQMAEGASYDLLISDLSLPDGSGLDLMRHLRPVQPALKSIALTGFTESRDVQDCKDAGFNAYIPKPIDFNKLRSVIDELAKGR